MRSDVLETGQKILAVYVNLAAIMEGLDLTEEDLDKFIQAADTADAAGPLLQPQAFLGNTNTYQEIKLARERASILLRVLKNIEEVRSLLIDEIRKNGGVK